jgi:hypothetical protein
MAKKHSSTSLSLVPRDQLERQALIMRRRMRNASIASTRTRRRVMTALVGAGAAYGAGFIVGRRIAQGLPVIGGGAALGGMLMAAGIGKAKGAETAGEFLESAGMGILAYYAGSRGEAHGGRSVQAAA